MTHQRLEQLVQQLAQEYELATLVDARHAGRASESLLEKHAKQLRELLLLHSKNLERLLNKVNLVTSYWRGMQLTHKRGLFELCDRQVEVEQAVAHALSFFESAHAQSPVPFVIHWKTLDGIKSQTEAYEKPRGNLLRWLNQKMTSDTVVEPPADSKVVFRTYERVGERIDGTQTHFYYREREKS